MTGTSAPAPPHASPLAAAKQQQGQVKEINRSLLLLLLQLLPCKEVQCSISEGLLVLSLSRQLQRAAAPAW